MTYSVGVRGTKEGVLAGLVLKFATIVKEQPAHKEDLPIVEAAVAEILKKLADPAPDYEVVLNVSGSVWFPTAGPPDTGGSIGMSISASISPMSPA